MDYILLGAPGVGKGTQAHKIVEKFGVVQISTGDMLRDHKSRKTEFGIEAASYFDRGHLVPDHLIIDMIEDRLKQDDVKNGVLFDGFPRTIPQGEALTDLYKKINREIAMVIRIILPEEDIVERITGRRSCLDCGAPYHVKFKPTKVEGVCDNCKGNRVIARADDCEETVKERVEVYKKQTQPLVEYFRNQNILWEIRGDEAIDAITEKIFKKLKELRQE